MLPGRARSPKLLGFSGRRKRPRFLSGLEPRNRVCRQARGNSGGTELAGDLGELGRAAGQGCSRETSRARREL